MSILYQDNLTRVTVYTYKNTMRIVHVWVIHDTFVNISKCILAYMINGRRCMQPSEMEMEKLLPAIHFSHLATGAMTLWSASGTHGKQ